MIARRAKIEVGPPSSFLCGSRVPQTQSIMFNGPEEASSQHVERMHACTLEFTASGRRLHGR